MEKPTHENVGECESVGSSTRPRNMKERNIKDTMWRKEVKKI